MLHTLHLILLSGAAVAARNGANGLSDAFASATKANDGTLSGSFFLGNLTLRLDGRQHDIFVIDYGIEVDGFPSFQVLHHSGDTSGFEMTYSETRAMLDNYMGDGPLPLAAAMDSYRVNRYNITENKIYTNRLIQGGQRYQKLNISTAGDLVLTALGIRLPQPRLPIEEIPGKFECSDESLNNIWMTGARTIQRTEITAGTTPEFYEISDQGLLCESQVPQPYSSIRASALTSYDLIFQAKALKGGFGYTVLSDTLGNGIYILVDVENLSIAAYAGSKELGGSPLAEAILNPDSVSLNAWHEVHTRVNVTDITVAINGAAALDFSQTSSFYGSFRLGASFQHKALYQNVTLSSNGDEILKSSLTSKADLDYFLAGTNPLSVSVDGAQRDRIAYSGDLEIAVRTTFASTYGIEYLNGSFNLLGSFQHTPGLFVPTVKIQQSPRTERIDANVTGLVGYSFSLVSAMGEYYMMTADVDFAHRWAHSQCSGLFNVTDASLGGDWDYYDPAQTGVFSKFNAAYAHALQSAVPMLGAADAAPCTRTSGPPT